MNNNLETVSEQLIKAFSVVMNANTSVLERNEANRVIEDFKENSSQCAECGFFLLSPTNSSVIRYFGLHLIEHYINLHWNTISIEEKYNIKNNILEILSKGVSINEDNHVKNALSKIVVQIIKREWPQQWPSLLEELHTICIIGDVQTELVLLIFLRLAEDIVQFQNVPDKRRREVYKALSLHLNDLFSFFTKTLTDQCEKYFALKNMQMKSDVMQNHCHVAQVTLETLSVFFEWIPINHITEDPRFFKQLCHLLNDEQLQISAAKCLLSLAERKGRPEDRIPVLELLKEAELLKIHIQTSQTLMQYYTFLKFLCQTLVTLGTSLCSLMTQFEKLREPETFPLYLECILSLTKHSSVVISHRTQSLWLCVLRDKKFCLNPFVTSIIPDLLKCEAGKLFKIGFPSKANSKASEYSLLDYDSDEDFELAFHKFRSDVCDVLRVITKHYPELAFRYGSSLLKPLLNGQACPILTEIEDSHTLDVLSVWDFIVHYFDAVSTSLMKNFDLCDIQILSQEGVELLQMTLNFNSEDLYVVSYALSCTSALFHFANFCSEALAPVFNKIFSNLVSHSGEEKNALPKDVLNLRRHSCALLIKLCSIHAKMLLPVFDHLCDYVKKLLKMEEHLSTLEKNALLESIMILSNELCDYDRQLKFLNEMLSPVLSVWLRDDLKTMISSPENFISFIGLNEQPEEVNDVTFKNRCQLLLCINVIKTCAKRCKIVTDPDIAEKGNFIHPLSQTVNSVLYRNPSAEVLVPAFTGVFCLIRTLNSLHDPAIQMKMHPEFSDVTSITDNDKNNILGISNAEENKQSKSPLERMKMYVQGIYDGCLQALGDAAENICIDFYMVPNLSNFFTECLFHCLQYMPDNRIRFIIRTFLKPFFYRCPVDLCGNLVNVLIEFCNYMFQKLTSTWQRFKQRYGTSIGYEDQMTEIQEIFEDQLNRLLTREYISFLGTLLQSKTVLDSSENHMEEDSKEHISTPQSKQLSELGLKIFQTEAVRGIIVCTVFDGLHWLDTVTNVHCISICQLVLAQLLKDGYIHQLEEANYLLQNALYGLQELGEHESNQGLLLLFCMSVYEKLRPLFPDLRETLMSCIGCDLQIVEKMESILLKDGIQKPAVERAKKEAFKQVVQKIIGRNIGQYHRREVIIKDLPPLFILPKEKNPDITILNEDIGLCQLFVSSS